MMTAAPAQKEYHFAATAEHYAEVVYAATISEAEAIYHKVKRPIGQPVAVETPAAPLSTAAPAPSEEGVQ